MLFPKGAPARQKIQNPIGPRRFAPSSQGASIGLGPSQRLITGHCCSAATGSEGRISLLSRFLSCARSLLTRKFRVAISGTIGSRPFDCAFRDEEIEQTFGSP